MLRARKTGWRDCDGADFVLQFTLIKLAVARAMARRCGRWVRNGYGSHVEKNRASHACLNVKSPQLHVAQATSHGRSLLAGFRLDDINPHDFAADVLQQVEQRPASLADPLTTACGNRRSAPERCGPSCMTMEDGVRPRADGLLHEKCVLIMRAGYYEYVFSKKQFSPNKQV